MDEMKKERFVCAKSTQLGWSWYGDDIYVHGFAYRKGEDCNNCKEYKNRQLSSEKYCKEN